MLHFHLCGKKWLKRKLVTKASLIQEERSTGYSRYLLSLSGYGSEEQEEEGDLFRGWG